MRRMRSPCCARAPRGHAIAKPPTMPMNSRRLMAYPARCSRPERKQFFVTGPSDQMSETGQSRPNWVVCTTSAFPLIATKQQTSLEVRFVPGPDSCTAANGVAIRTSRRRYFSFSQTRVTTLILPSLAKGAGRATYIIRSPSRCTSRMFVVPAQTSFHERSRWCTTLLPS
jgi:hypothetical protein